MRKNDLSKLIQVKNNWEGINDNLKSSHTSEQFIYRTYLVYSKSPVCLKSGSCKKCGCATPELFFANKACEAGCYTEMMDKKTWEDYKEENKIDLLQMYKTIEQYI